MLAGLCAALMDADEDKGIAAIIIAAEGSAFSAGHNLKELTAHRADSDKGAAYFERTFDICARVMTMIAQHRCPVIAEVDGLASAAGCQLVATCDLAYASDRAIFCTPGVNIGLFCSTPMVALSRSVSSKHAMEMLLTGGVYDAAYAHRIGLINEILPQNQLSGHVSDIAQLITQKSQGAIKHGKAAFHQQRLMNLEDSYTYCSAIMVQNMLEGCACEGLAAFLEKRKPQWPAI
jgi:enoyl-CoA hydratase/carnithine racemase